MKKIIILLKLKLDKTIIYKIITLDTYNLQLVFFRKYTKDTLFWNFYLIIINIKNLVR